MSGQSTDKKQSKEVAKVQRQSRGETLNANEQKNKSTKSKQNDMNKAESKQNDRRSAELKQNGKSNGVEPMQSTDSQGVSEQNSMQKGKSQADIQQHKPWLVRHVWWVDALLFIGGTLVLAGLATLLGGEMFNFKNYKMPMGVVPKIVFPIMWAVIYVAIGVSTFLMWRDKEIKSKDRKINLIVYFVHMFFNVLWPLFFFRLNLPVFSAVWLLLVVITALIVTFRYYLANIASGVIFSIYTLWLIYAMYLNLGLVLINFM